LAFLVSAAPNLLNNRWAVAHSAATLETDVNHAETSGQGNPLFVSEFFMPNMCWIYDD
jgi:hypothetical protein